MLRQPLLIALLLLAASLPAARPAASAPAPSALDLLPLKKALSPLESLGGIKSRTTICMTGSQQGMAVTLREQLQIIARRPGRFRAALTQFDTQGRARTRLVVVSDGVHVWTYRPGLRQYSVMSFAAFEAAENDIPTLGLITGGFYLGDGYPLVQGFRSVTPDNSADVAAALSGMAVTLSRQTQSVAGQDDYVYRLVLSKQNLEYQFYVNSETDTLSRVDLTGAQGGIQITYREDIARLMPLADLPKSTFLFVPPPGTFRAASLSVDPFQARPPQNVP